MVKFGTTFAIWAGTFLLATSLPIAPFGSSGVLDYAATLPSKSHAKNGRDLVDDVQRSQVLGQRQVDNESTFGAGSQGSGNDGGGSDGGSQSAFLI